MKLLTKALIPILVLAFLHSCYSDDISDLDARIEKVENSTIATITQQLSSIETSLGLLQGTDQDLRILITNLQTTEENLRKSLDDANGLIATNQSDMSGQLEVLRSSTNAKVAELDSLIQYLNSKDDSLSLRISSLSRYVDEESNSTRSWVETTFSTLAQYDSIMTELQAVKLSIEKINNAMSELEQRTNATIKATIDSAMIVMSTSLRDSVSKVTTAYSTAISTAREEVTAAYTTAIRTAIESSETSMKAWVNQQLTGYYTIAQADAKANLQMITLGSMLNNQKVELLNLISSLDDSICAELGNRDSLIAAMILRTDTLEARITSSESAILKLKSDLTKQKSEITRTYTTAIHTAIDSLGGMLDSITEAKVVAINKAIVDSIYVRLEKLDAGVARLSHDVDSIYASISSINAQITDLRRDVDALLASVQSVTVIPDYSDGSVSLLKLTPTQNKVRFEIYPRTIAKQLVDKGTSVFNMSAVYTKTKAGGVVDMPVTNVVYDNGIVELTVDASAIDNDVYYWKNGISLNARLLISNENTCISSNYFLFTPTVPGAVDLGLSVWWATNNLDADGDGTADQFTWGCVTPYAGVACYLPTALNIQGGQYDAATDILGNSWCIPSDADFGELASNCQVIERQGYAVVIGPSGKSIIMDYVSDGRYWTSYSYTFASTKRRIVSYKIWYDDSSYPVDIRIRSDYTDYASAASSTSEAKYIRPICR